MKPRNPFVLPGSSYKTLLTKVAMPFILLCFLFPNTISAQCGAGYSKVTLDWDYLDYFSYTGLYTNTAANAYLTGNAQAQTQNFTFGTQRLTITNSFNNAENLGENALHTGDANSYGVGSQDVNFNANGTITLTFENEVQSLKFSIFDLDQSQKMTVTAKNAASANLPVILSKATPLALSVSITALPLTGPSATATAASLANTSPNNTINVDIAGPVKTVTITMGGTAGDFWMSNITACSAGTFPTGYHVVSKPFSTQPGYVLTALDKSVYMVDAATGASKLLFTDPGGNINSMGYDPYNRILYYVYSLTGNAGANTALKKYDVDTKTISTILGDVRTIGIPLVTVSGGSTIYGTGVESGAASFYNGSLFLGIETSNKDGSGLLATSAREAVIWRIDFDASNTPYRSAQAFALPNDNGSGTLLHDWSDFVLTNGILYDFDGAGTTTQTDVYHFDMITGTAVDYPTPAGWTPGQPVVDWQENIHQLYGAAAVNPYIALYNGNGTIGTRHNLFSTPMFSPTFPSVGDGAEGFRPLADFGDAPASYDPASGDPAVHEIDANLRLGAAESDEFVTRGQTALANSDNNEDALGAAPPLLNFAGTVTYTVPNISVFNNTGANATLIAWLDYNMNGVFDAGEGRLVTVPTSATTQLVSITWTSIPVANTAAVRTYLRLRLTRSANGMTTSNMTGYMPDGEVEDYPVVLGINLPVEIASFDVQKGNGKTAILNWITSGDMADNAAFEIERSTDAQQWAKIGTVTTSILQATTDHFSYQDANALTGKSYYRIKTVSKDGSFRYSVVKSIAFSFLKGTVKVSPNPVTDYVTIQLSSEHTATIKIALYDYSGKTVYEKNTSVAAGDNTIRLTDVKTVLSGMYYIKINIGDEMFTDKLIIVKN